MIIKFLNISKTILKNLNFRKTFLIVFSLMILLNFTTVNLADSSDEDFNEVENESIANELKLEEDSIINSSNQENSNPVLNSRRYVIFDRKSNLGIYGKDENKQSAMASTTKIMTRYSSTRKLP